MNPDRPSAHTRGEKPSKAKMEEREFRRLLDLFPVVRSRDYCAESGSTSASTSRPAQNQISERNNAWDESEEKDLKEINSEDKFWQKLRVAAEKRYVGPAKAEQFCEAFRMAHETLVHKELSVDAAQKFINAEGN
uniref:Uncharacterized protein n=1 Tax=Ananas comosus var. bracteatus TaxID=296719 RepID=A0A6V7Q9Z4_ANACO|nr:unnamed protein product [Ananas comosus var. bracteatus]